MNDNKDYKELWKVAEKRLAKATFTVTALSMVLRQLGLNRNAINDIFNQINEKVDYIFEEEEKVEL